MLKRENIERRMRITQQTLVIFMLIALISSGMWQGTMAARPNALPHCTTRNDCLPLCKGCGFCQCLGGICVRGCPGPPGQDLVYKAFCDYCN
ncbi:hypothetical protein HanIR_Chr08g0351561 [Helianthus annuus]|nr:hypothetical protein HanIR_Chr08g0351561 [Helianthus annuus]